LFLVSRIERAKDKERKRKIQIQTLGGEVAAAASPRFSLSLFSSHPSLTSSLSSPFGQTNKL
jgi:hypothetical protein